MILLGGISLFGEPVSLAAAFFLLAALVLCLSFEFVNGFHDTANAVATVIYTHTLRPNFAVVWSGCFNLLGVLLSSGAVAYSVVSLLPMELVLGSSSGASFAMIFALLISAICWNLGTWYLGLPASSSHTLIGAIMGVGIANAIMAGRGWTSGINWSKAGEIGTWLLLSPLIGFFVAAGLLLLLKALVHREDLYRSPEKDSVPPLWIRGVLMLTCTLVSFSHGSNDGQKGMGLMMLILIGLVPAAFALNLDRDGARFAAVGDGLRKLADTAKNLAHGGNINQKDADEELMRYAKSGGAAGDATYAAIELESRTVAEKLEKAKSLAALSRDERKTMRNHIYLIAECLGKLRAGRQINDSAVAAFLTEEESRLNDVVKYIPLWVKVAVALALGLGTMIGWKRIVVTVGEKIGKSHLTYAQGAVAEFTAASVIAIADTHGLPVSTTHVLSSGIAGSMAANKSGLQKDTLISILLAWVLTLPACIFLGALLFSLGFFVTFRLLGIR
jgi:PiT family inorganic phosphate transporter